MKRTLMAGAIATALWTVPALAGDDHTSATTTETRTDTTTMVPTDDGMGTTTMVPSTTTSESQHTQVTVMDESDKKNRESRDDMRGLTVLAGAGVEGYSGDLAPQINLGPAWNVRAAMKPSKVLGIELGYSGALNEIKGSDNIFGPGIGSGPDIVRNGGEALATVGLVAAPVQPYLLGGVGVSRYVVRNEGNGFADDTTGSIPLGGGVRGHVGNLTADARFGYSVLFDQQFASNVDPRDLVGLNSTSGGRYQGTLNIGTTF